MIDDAGDNICWCRGAAADCAEHLVTMWLCRYITITSHKLRLWQTQGPWPWSFLTLHGLSVHWSKHDLPQLEKIYFHQIISVWCNNDTPLPPPTHPEPIKRSQWPCSWLIWPYYAGSGHPAMFYSHHLCWNFSHYFQNSLGLTTPLWFLGWVSLRLTAGRRN